MRPAARRERPNPGHVAEVAPIAGGENLWSDERKRPLILPIGMHFPGLCAKMPYGLCSAAGQTS
jgi:hypothetical protein